MGEICVLYRNDGFTVWIVWFCLNTELRACLFPRGSAFRPSFGGPIEASSLFLNEDYFFILSLWIHKVSHRFSQRGAWDVSSSRMSRPRQSADISSLYILHIFQRRQKILFERRFLYLFKWSDSDLRACLGGFGKALFIGCIPERPYRLYRLLDALSYRFNSTCAATA